jgi:hypothetical protein
MRRRKKHDGACRDEGHKKVSDSDAFESHGLTSMDLLKLSG